MADKPDLDRMQTEAFIKRSFEGVIGKYVNLRTQYADLEDIDLIEKEYEKLLAQQLLGILKLRNREGRMAIIDQLEELIHLETTPKTGKKASKGSGATQKKSKPSSAPIKSAAPTKLATPTQEEPLVIEMLLNDGSAFPIYPSDVKRWEDLYPAVDIIAQLRKMAGWCDANPKRRKTKNGIKRFINSWLAGEQDKGGANYLPGTQRSAEMMIHPDGTAHPDGGIWMNGKQVLGVKPE